MTWLHAGWPRDQDRFLAGARDFSLLNSIQTASGEHLASVPWITGIPSPEIRRPGRHKMLESSWVAAQLTASQEGLSSMSEWVSYNSISTWRLWTTYGGTLAKWFCKLYTGSILRKQTKFYSGSSAFSDFQKSARSKARTVFARSNTGILGSNPIRGMDVCLRLFCLC
jgi:hypothetical protein